MKTNLAEKFDEQQLEQQALTLADQAKALVVKDEQTLAIAGEFGKSLREMKKSITDFFSPMKKKAHEAWKEICGKENEAIKPIDEADAALRKSMNTFLQEQERKRQEAERKARLEAEEKARKEQEKLLARAAKAEEKGHAEKAEALLEQAEDVYAAPIATSRVEAVKTDTATTLAQKELKVEVVNLKAFVAELVKQDSNAFDALFKVNASPLKAWVKTNGIKKFAGLHIEETVSARIR